MTRTPLAKYIFTILLSLSVLLILPGCRQKINNVGGEENDKYDSPDQAMQFEFDRTKDPATGKVPRNLLMSAMLYTDSLKAALPFQLIAGYGNWTERGPTYDAVGVSNGNTRANNGIASGRVRAIFVDGADATGNTIWLGGVNGGIWKTTDITASPATWTFVNDFFSNMAVTGICQDPTNTNTMYFCTGEAFYNADAVGGDGIFKSIDHGVTWSQLANTTGPNFDYCTKILCDASGNIYLSTRAGVYRSNNGGGIWTAITPNPLTANGYSDMELSSTGRLHVSYGIFGACTYRYTDNPSTVNIATWTSPTSGYPSSNVRIELGCNGNTLYALPADASYQVPTIYKSTDGGANWAATTGQPTAGWASGQAWYSLAVDLDAAGNVIVGGLDPYRSTDGGATWAKLSDWTNNAGLPPTTTQYVHADIHFIKLYGLNRVLFGCDGGIFYSSNSGTTIRDRNSGLRIKQFYSCAIHPSTTNYFLAGAQDNGCHQFGSAGIGSTTEVTGGDGAFVHIDQDEPQYQFTSYLYNQYYRSSNSGGSWTSTTLIGGSVGQFINPTDYDNTANIMYCGNSAGTYRRWTNPQSGTTSTSVSITALNGNSITAVSVSPYTSNRVYFGTKNDVGSSRLCYVDAANTIVSGSPGTNISTGLPTNVTTSCVAIGTDDQHLMVSYSNYGVASVWISSDGGSSWTSLDNNGVNLPDMPVRWCMFIPGTNTGAIIATEAGVYVTTSFTGTTTPWFPSPSFPTVRTDMLAYRSSDGLIAAATHGRGLWTQPYYTIVPSNNFLLKGRWQNNTTVELSWEYDGPNTATSMDIEESTDALHFYKVASLAYNGKYYTYTYSPGQKNVYYRIKSNEASGYDLYSNSIRLSKNSTGNTLTIQSIFPNPVKNDINIAFSISAKGPATYLVTNLAGQTVMRKEEDLQYTGVYKKNWSLRGLPAGVYTLTLVWGTEKRSQKFVKQ